MTTATTPQGADGAMTGAELAALEAERNQLLVDKQANSEVLIACRAQIEAAKAKANEGEYADSRWFAAVNTRARFAGHEDQRIQGRLSIIRNLIKQEHLRQHQAERQGDSDATQLLREAMALISRALDRL
jgi:hypothetical protein